MNRTAQNLLFDADDTLWQNNIYFERAISAFISFLDHRVHTPAEIREYLNAVEQKTVASHGYGLKSFRISLARCFQDLTGGFVTPEKHQSLETFADSIAEQEIELLPGVADTLHQLAKRHTLLLVTKGDHAEQTGKLVRSGLLPHFSAVEVLAEKTAFAYADLLSRHRCLLSQTWMIGNSPRSDINPAMAAGISTVFIPHDFTWVLEHEALDPAPSGSHLIQLNTFSDLLHHF